MCCYVKTEEISKSVYSFRNKKQFTRHASVDTLFFYLLRYIECMNEPKNEIMRLFWLV